MIGPEAPLIAIGSGFALLTLGLARRDVPPPVLMVVAAAGSFSALSFIFASPLIAAVILIEATGLGGPKLPLVLVPGLLAAGIGSLVSLGLGSFSGLSSSAYAIGALDVPVFKHPTIASSDGRSRSRSRSPIVARLIMHGGLSTHRFVVGRSRLMLLLLPAIGLVVAGLAIAFSQITGKGVDEVLFSGQDQLPGLVSQAGTWSLSALALLIVFKGVAYALSLGSFRGGPTFPAMFLGAVAGVLASHLAGFPLTPAVAVGIGAATVSVLRLPLSAVVIATLLTVKGGGGAEPLIIVGVVVAHLVTLQIAPPGRPEPVAGDEGAAATARARTPLPAS